MNRESSNSPGDRLPPQSIEAEMGVIGSCLLDNAMIDECALILKADDFYRSDHEVMWRLICRMRDDGLAVDATTFAERLEREGVFEKFGGDETLGEICNTPPHAAHATYYAQIVREKSIGRQLIETHTDGLRDAYSNQFTAQELLANAERRVFAIAETEVVGTTIGAPELMAEADARFDMRLRGEAPGIATGLADLDQLTGGFRNQQLIVVAGRPGMGKTVFGIDVAVFVSGRIGPVLFVSLEMGRDELADRMIAAQSRIEGHRLQIARYLDEREQAEARKAMGTIAKLKLRIDDTPARSMGQIAANSRRIKAKPDGLAMIVIDYLGLIATPELSHRSRQEEVSMISRRLKHLAREIDVPVVALHQLNRENEKRDGHRPRLSDLRDSGSIEQDADKVILIHRPEIYDPADSPGIAEMIVAKNRNGGTGMVKVMFSKAITKFEPLSTIHEPIPDRQEKVF